MNDPVDLTLRPEDFQQHEVDLRLRVKLVLHPEVLRTTTDPDGERNCYGFMEPDDVITHLLFNLLQGRRLSQLDGWADLPPYAGFVDALSDLEVYDHEVVTVPDYLLDAIRWDAERYIEQRAKTAENREKQP